MTIYVHWALELLAEEDVTKLQNLDLNLYDFIVQMRATHEMVKNAGLVWDMSAYAKKMNEAWSIITYCLVKNAEDGLVNEDLYEEAIRPILSRSFRVLASAKQGASRL